MPLVLKTNINFKNCQKYIPASKRQNKFVQVLQDCSNKEAVTDL